MASLGRWHREGCVGEPPSRGITSLLGDKLSCISYSFMNITNSIDLQSWPPWRNCPTALHGTSSPVLSTRRSHACRLSWCVGWRANATFLGSDPRSARHHSDSAERRRIRRGHTHKNRRGAADEPGHKPSTVCTPSRRRYSRRSSAWIFSDTTSSACATRASLMPFLWQVGQVGSEAVLGDFEPPSPGHRSDCGHPPPVSHGALSAA